MQSNRFYTNKTLNVRGTLLDLGSPKIMGIINVTPDSFFDGGRYQEEKSLLSHAGQLLEEGATFLDVGGYSSRPHAKPVPEEEELKRVIHAVSAIQREFPDAFISVDTFRSAVARAALDHGAVMINDISGGEGDSEMIDLLANSKVPYVLMHMRGTPETMTSMTDYSDIVEDILNYFQERIRTLHERGVADIILDPGFGFAKTREQNFRLLKSLDLFLVCGKPLLVGLSRKSMIWRTLDISAENALNGTTALHAVALLKGASILRVHDVKEAMECIRLIASIPATRETYLDSHPNM